MSASFFGCLFYNSVWYSRVFFFCRRILCWTLDGNVNRFGVATFILIFGSFSLAYFYYSLSISQPFHFIQLAMNLCSPPNATLRWIWIFLLLPKDDVRVNIRFVFVLCDWLLLNAPTWILVLILLLFFSTLCAPLLLCFFYIIYVLENLIQYTGDDDMHGRHVHAMAWSKHKPKYYHIIFAHCKMCFIHAFELYA